MRKSKKCAGVGAAVLSLSLMLSNFGGIAANAAGEQINVRSESQTQMSSDPEVVYVNTYNDSTVRTQNFDSNWKFNLGDVSGANEVSFDDSKWRQLSLPHDYSIEQNFDQNYEAESGYLPGGTGWYRKNFTVSEDLKDKELRIDFGGVYMNATVWVNGEQLGTHPYGYTPFSFDITDQVEFGKENVIAVKVDHKTPSSRWYSGSGIYRSVELTIMDKVHVGLYGTKVTTPDLATEKGGTVNMNIDTTVQNETDAAQNVVLTHTVYEKGTENSIGTITTTGQEIAAGQSAVIQAVVPAQNPTLWSTENPALYTVRTEVKVGSRVTDTYETEYGFRYISMDKNTGFYLNGEKLKLKGVCMHHDQGALGAAAYRRAIQRQVEILKEMGCNSIRVTHNPAADELIEICNEEGILVIDEFFDGWMFPKNNNTYDYSTAFNKAIESGNAILGSREGMTWAEFDLKATVNRGKNAPSVIMWSLGNEIQEGAGGSGYDTKAQDLIRWTQEVNTDKILTIGSNKVKDGWPEHINIANQLTAVGGASGTNYSGGGSYDALHSSYPNWLLYGSETASSVNSRGVYNTKANATLNSEKQLTSYDKSKVGWGALASEAWFDVITRDFVAGEYVWTGFDYIGEPTPANNINAGATGGWPSPKNSFFGIIDTAGLPKDSYYFYQSQWNDKVNTLHVLPAWNEDVVVKEGTNKEVEVVVYSDAASVELFLNDQSLGKKEFTKETTAAGYTYQYCGTKSHQNLYMTWRVPFQAGTLKAVAYDENGDVIEKTEGRSVVKTTGAEAKLKASADRTKITADGKDLSYITVDVTDAEGNIVPDAENRVTFKVEGDGVLVGVDNGSSPDHDSYKADNREAFSGKLIAIVQSTRKAGSIKVTASAEGLDSASVTINTEAADSGSGEEAKQIDNFFMSRNYYVKSGNAPTLPDQLEARYADGSSEQKAVVWDKIPEDLLSQTGTFQVYGTVDGKIRVAVNVNVIDQIGGLLNYSVSTPKGQQAALPENRPAVMPDGTVLTTAFAVEWDAEDLAAVNWNKEGVYPVAGTANVLGETVNVTAKIRVAEQQLTLGDSVSKAARLSQDIPEGKQDDTLDAIKDGKTEIVFPNSGPNQTAWSNWTMSQEGDTTAELTFSYDTQQSIGQINIWFARDQLSMRYPQADTTEIWIQANDGSEWSKVDATESFTPSDEIGVNKYTYTFTPVAATHVQFRLTNTTIPTGTNRKACIGITEIELLKSEGNYVTHNTANLASLTVNGQKVSEGDLASGSYVTPALFAEVEAEGADNAAVTVLPAKDNKIKIIIESEDHAVRNVFEIKLAADPEEVNRDYPVEKLTAIAGSEYPGTGGEGPANLVLDGNGQTHWHTDWGGSDGQDVAKRWIGLKLEEAASVDGIRYLPRLQGNGNGAVTEYRVEYRTSDDGEWTAIEGATGTWDPNDREWKLIQFSPVTAKQIRVVGVHTYADSGTDKHMTTAELRVTVAGIDISDAEAVIDPDQIEVPLVDEEHPVTPEVAVTKDGKALRYGIDYVVKYENNTAAGDATAIVIGIGEYSGEIRVPFTIIADQTPTLNSITVSKTPKLSYIEDEMFDPKGMEITLHYSDNSTKVVKYDDAKNDFTFSPSLETKLTTDVQEIEVTYKEKSAKIKITVSPKQVTVTKISVKSEPKRTEYKVGEYFDPEGLELTCEYSDGSKKDVVYASVGGEGFTFEPSLDTPLTREHKEFVVGYGGQTTKVGITVTDDDTPVVPEEPNKDELQSTVDGYKDNYKEESYSESAWRDYEKALKDAEDVLASDKADQDDIDKALDDLKKAAAALDLEANARKEIQEYYEKCLAYYKEADYKDQPKEWAAYVKAMDQLKKVLDDKNSTAKEMYDAMEAVAEAAAALGKEDGGSSSEPQPPKTPDTVRTGDTAAVLPIVIVLIAAAAAIVAMIVIKKKKR